MVTLTARSAAAERARPQRIQGRGYWAQGQGQGFKPSGLGDSTTLNRGRPRVDVRGSKPSGSRSGDSRIVVTWCAACVMAQTPPTRKICTHGAKLVGKWRLSKESWVSWIRGSLVTSRPRFPRRRRAVLLTSVVKKIRKLSAVLFPAVEGAAGAGGISVTRSRCAGVVRLTRECCR